MPKPYIPNDKWSRKAAEEGFRARSVYKLMELDERFDLLHPGMTVLDLGAAPGSWLQYASQKIGPKGRAIGIDLQAIESIAPNVSLHRFDITNAQAMDAMLKQENVARCDLVLSDIAPNTSGVKDVDQWRSVELVREVITIAQRLLRQGGFCAVKVFRGAAFDELIRDINMSGAWQRPRVSKVMASRDRSKEVYVVMKKM
jgi:23S rRNA (uridine2552-2'-O)-methyltransferase